MERVEITDRDMRIAVADVERRKEEIASECLKVWDSMSGKLPPFDKFCEMYMKDRFERWLRQARWN